MFLNFWNPILHEKNQKYKKFIENTNTFMFLTFSLIKQPNHRLQQGRPRPSVSSLMESDLQFKGVKNFVIL
jgi:hypothetical protein